MATHPRIRSTKNHAVKILSEDSDLLREIIQVTLKEMLEGLLDESIGAKKENVLNLALVIAQATTGVA